MIYERLNVTAVSGAGIDEVALDLLARQGFDSGSVDVVPDCITLNPTEYTMNEWFARDGFEARVLYCGEKLYNDDRKGTRVGVFLLHPSKRTLRIAYEPPITGYKVPWPLLRQAGCEPFLRQLVASNILTVPTRICLPEHNIDILVGEELND